MASSSAGLLSASRSFPERTRRAADDACQTEPNLEPAPGNSEEPVSFSRCSEPTRFFSGAAFASGGPSCPRLAAVSIDEDNYEADERDPTEGGAAWAHDANEQDILGGVKQLLRKVQQAG